MQKRSKRENRKTYDTAGLFAGIGGIELGFAKAGHVPRVLCEIDPSAQRILARHFPQVPIVSDVRTLRTLGDAEVLCAGFPCQDLSQAGKTAGISGSQSGLITEIFRLIDSSTTLEWVFLENVPFMLHLDRGAAMSFIVGEFGRRGYMWAYRVVDSGGFGLPQRRRRVLFLASKHRDPRSALLNDDDGVCQEKGKCDVFGFYWTEGNTGLGWAQDSIPTLKGGSGLGIPSPPAIWIRKRGIFLPDVRDAERLQGFRPNWTALGVSASNGRVGIRWKLLGNAVSVPVAEWVATRLCVQDAYEEGHDKQLTGQHQWQSAGWGIKSKRFAADLGPWPIRKRRIGLAKFLKFPLAPLSLAATEGFYTRARLSRLKFQDGFLEGVSDHLEIMRSKTRSAA